MIIIFILGLILISGCGRSYYYDIDCSDDCIPGWEKENYISSDGCFCDKVIKEGFIKIGRGLNDVKEDLCGKEKMTIQVLNANGGNR